MVKIRSSDPLVQSQLSDLLEILSSQGAYFSPSLQIEVKGSDFSFSCRKKLAQKEKLISLPLVCMPKFNDFSWSLDEDEKLHFTALKPDDAGQFTTQRLIVEKMLQLYNHLVKIKHFAKSFPILNLIEHSELLECLLTHAHETALLQMLGQSREELIIQAFWGGRIFGDYLTDEFHLIPVMEFFDHSIFAGGFFWGQEGGERFLHSAYQPSERTKGLLARYELMDNFHAFVKYGFVDEKAFFIQSQPFSIQLSDSVLFDVSYQSATSNQCPLEKWTAQPAYSSSLMYRSTLRYIDDRVFVPFMLMPAARHMPAFDEALNAQLQEIEHHLQAQNGTFANERVMGEIKRKMLEENKSVYRKVAQVARDSSLDSRQQSTVLLKKMLNHQVKIIKEFDKAIA